MAFKRLNSKVKLTKGIMFGGGALNKSIRTAPLAPAHLDTATGAPAAGMALLRKKDVLAL